MFASSSGMLVDRLNGDWGVFFIITALMVIPALICLWVIRDKLADMLAGAEVRLFGKEVESG
jgi:PAT family beta-lactamase induction signal transducer AmpG